MNILEIPFEFVDAIDGRYGLPSEYENQIDRIAGLKKAVYLSDAEYACALSHMKTYGMIIDKNIQWALIMEDDAIPSYELVAYLEGNHFKGAELTQLIYGMPTYVRRKGKIHIFGKYSSYLRSIAGKAQAAVGYVISNKAAKYILENGIPINRHADWPDCVSTLIYNNDFRIVYPQLIYHSNERSSSILLKYSRNILKIKLRIFGIYIPPMNYVIRSISRVPRKIFDIKLRK